MREILKEVLSGPCKSTLLYFTYKAWCVDEDDLRYYGSKAKVHYI